MLWWGESGRVLNFRLAVLATSWKRVLFPRSAASLFQNTLNFRKGFNGAKSGLDSGGGALAGRFPCALVGERGLSLILGGTLILGSRWPCRLAPWRRLSSSVARRDGLWVQDAALSLLIWRILVTIEGRKHRLTHRIKKEGRKALRQEGMNRRRFGTDLHGGRH